ncbi:MAG: helix-turn-helix transcriptional regulator [Bacilli bacterium]
MNDLQSYLEKALNKVNLSETDDYCEQIEYDLEAEVRELIIKTRIEQKMTQKQLALKSGVSQANLSKIENGNYKLSLVTIQKIANGLEKRVVVDFIEEDGEF